MMNAKTSSLQVLLKGLINLRVEDIVTMVKGKFSGIKGDAMGPIRLSLKKRESTDVPLHFLLRAIIECANPHNNLYSCVEICDLGQVSVLIDNGEYNIIQKREEVVCVVDIKISFPRSIPDSL